MKKMITILGPTASGKTPLAAALAAASTTTSILQVIVASGRYGCRQFVNFVHQFVKISIFCL